MHVAEVPHAGCKTSGDNGRQGRRLRHDRRVSGRAGAGRVSPESQLFDPKGTRDRCFGRDRAGPSRTGQLLFPKTDACFVIAPWHKQTSAGPISVCLAHDVDLVRCLFGMIVGVQARAAGSRRGYENEVVAAAVLLCDSGAVGTIPVSERIVALWG